jgi:hypothetical protein
MPKMRVMAVWQKVGSMNLRDSILAAIARVRPGTDPVHAERITREVAALIKREFMWLDIVEGLTPEPQAKGKK